MKLPKPDSESARQVPESEASGSDDVALVHAAGDDGALHVIRKRGEQLEAGVVKPLREGAPIHGELVTLRPRPNFPLLCDVQVHYRPPSAPAPAKPAPRAPARRKGPPQVASESYRENWDSIWATKKTDALN